MLLRVIIVLAAEPALAISSFAFLPREPHNGIVRRDCMAATPSSNLTAVSARIRCLLQKFTHSNWKSDRRSCVQWESTKQYTHLH